MSLPPNRNAKPRVLVAAYSCVSESGVTQVGGEAELGFNIIEQLDKFCSVSVLTHAHNKDAILKKLTTNPLEDTEFFYIQLPAALGFLEPLHSGGIQIYAYLWQIQAYFFAKKLHTKNPFDLFHHVTYANDWMASYIGAFLPVPYVRGPGGGAHRIPKAFLETYGVKDRLKESVRSIGQWLFRHDPIFIKGQNRAQKLLVCNEEAFDILPAKWQRKAELFPVNGVSKEDLDISVAPRGENVLFSVVTAGKLLKLKNIDLGINAFAVFHKKYPSSQFTIIGDGPEFSRLQNLVEKLSLQHAIVFEKWLERKSLLKKISESDVFLFPSLRDGGGAVVVEAMAQAKPVVCLDIAGPGFHVDNSRGIKIKPQTVNQTVGDMALALEKLYLDASLRRSMGVAARKKAEEYYDWNVLGERLHGIYNEILKNITRGNRS